MPSCGSSSVWSLPQKRDRRRSFLCECGAFSSYSRILKTSTKKKAARQPKAPADCSTFNSDLGTLGALFPLFVPPESERTDLPLLERSHRYAEQPLETSTVQPAESATLFHKLIGLSRAAAWRIVGGLSRPSKMPCYAWGIPAQSCQVGAKLVEVEESVCRQCYAFRGYFRTHRVQAAYQRRLDCSGHPRWIEAMAKLIYWQTTESGEPYFRWFDSGDLQSVAMLRDIAAVARLTPEIRHWLPTREYGLLAEYLRSESPPPNLTIRVSAPLIDGPTPRRFGLPVSSIHRVTPAPDAVPCPAYSHEPAYCGTCRACWDQSVTNVSYPLH